MLCVRPTRSALRAQCALSQHTPKAFHHIVPHSLFQRCPLQRVRCVAAHASCRQPVTSLRSRHLHRTPLTIKATTPQPGTEEAPANAPQEWETPTPSKRPDIFPEFEKLQTVLPKPLPGDPELPDEELEEEKQRAPAPGDPDPEDEGEEGEEANTEPETPTKPPNVPERPKPDLPRIPD